LKKGNGLMREFHADPPANPRAGASTNFPIVPLEDIPAFGSSVDAGAPRPLVLVAVGEADAADALVDDLNRNGYAAIAAYDGEGALETALLVPPELVIADVELPGMSGTELATAVRSELPDCRILLLADEEPKADLPSPASRKGNEFEVLGKPIRESQLMARIAASFESRKAD